MEIAFRIQDPTRVDTTYLFEAILSAAQGAATWRGVYAFASRDGVNWLFEDPVIAQLITSGGEIDLLVGLDAITNRQTLERLQELEQGNNRFRPRVFWNEVFSLFHPKISEFTYPDGGRTLIVGSGNLTPGGLMNNLEAYTTVSADSSEEIDVTALDEFLEQHSGAIRNIDDEALARAEQNLIRRVTQGQQAGRVNISSPPRTRRPVRLVPTGTGSGVARMDRILIAQVPKAGGRWSQIHFNADVVREYFRLVDLGTQRVYLSQVGSNVGRSDEEARPLIYSSTNKNPKIEFAAASGRGYPASPPVLVLRERRIRAFDYMLLFPGDDGYDKAIGLTTTLPSVGRGMPRVITDMNTLQGAWAACPLLTSEAEDDPLV